MQDPYGRPPPAPAADPSPGTAWGGAAPQPAAAPSNGKAIAALVLGIVSCCVGGFLTGIPAIILGVMANKEINREPQRYSSGSKGMAITGIVLGGIMTGISLIVLLIYGVAIFAIIAECSENPESPACQDALDETGPNAAPWDLPVASAAPALAWTLPWMRPRPV